MRVISKLLAATAIAGALAAFSASAQAAVYIGLQEAGVNSGAITEVANGANAAGVIGLNYGAFDVNSITGTATVFPSILDSTSVNVNSVGGAAGTLDVYVTRTDLSTPFPDDFVTGFTQNFLSDGWTVQLRTYVNDSNSLWGGTLVGDETFNGLISTPEGRKDFASVATGPGNYSVTHRYTITSTGLGQANSTIALAAVPEPATWAFMIMGFGGAGAMLRRRRALAFA